MKIRQKDCVCEIPQHAAVLGDEHAAELAPRVESGPIAILPERRDNGTPGGTTVFLDAVESAGGVVSELNAETRGLIWLSYKKSAELGEVLDANPQLTWVQLPWAGVDAYADVLTRCARPGLVFTSAKGSYAQPVAEHALAMTLALLRALPRRARATSWDAVPRGISLYRKNITIIGAGGIARELIRLLEPFDVTITVVRRSAGQVPGAFSTVTTDRLDKALISADVVVIAAALTGETRHLIGAKELALMKKSAVVVNIARGPLVDPDALVVALNAEKISGAALDVTEPEPLPDGHPLWTAENILITPHMADTPEMTAPLLAERIRSNVTAFLAGERFTGVVDPSAGY
ncbi:phosphoglycerate dehydrogenase-like enzyme [Aurantimicrobium minutum]|uniref:D-isomer specific 2-hydroxyacid dehydrogenase family protein n=1 Tax=Aurantimicrobium minutum TaxID=708131 RepID=UPI002472F05C|nr:D-isomer specific 2-hydroxyacid dehydrogenase family protein [Aurantimicrobium minutum]MDH6533082.1 phosphoglycerate dehydrogenase-like enzyme [Aurantimicrobium minutum]